MIQVRYYDFPVEMRSGSSLATNTEIILGFPADFRSSLDMLGTHEGRILARLVSPRQAA